MMWCFDLMFYREGYICYYDHQPTSSSVTYLIIRYSHPRQYFLIVSVIDIKTLTPDLHGYIFKFSFPVAMKKKTLTNATWGRRIYLTYKPGYSCSLQEKSMWREFERAWKIASTVERREQWTHTCTLMSFSLGPYPSI